jgi:EEF1A lysine methyltransferase 4
MTIAEDQQLGLSEYWDSRYATSNNNDPTHEWFRSFSQVLPFLQKNLLEQPGRTAQDNPKILHLGSGDSVSSFTFKFFL